MTRTIAMTLTGFMGSLCEPNGAVCVALTFDMSGGRRQAKQAGGRPLDEWIRPHEMLWAFLRSCQNTHCLRRQVHLTQEIGETDDQGKGGAREERAHKPP